MNDSRDNSLPANAGLPQEETMAKKASKTRTHAEKAADFKSLANKHGGTAVKALDRLGKLARPGRYAWTSDQVEKIEKTLKAALDAAISRLSNPPKTGEKVTSSIL